ncbi:unnamed protein product, partial [Vitis vinifera]|uniref:Uncharacterized protein n=1 Tax=Vitis vinifera TaxID=29760 RepID=D7TTN4_VITVI
MRLELGILHDNSGSELLPELALMFHTLLVSQGILVKLKIQIEHLLTMR